MAAIMASKPVIVNGVTITYDQWYITKLVINADSTSAKTIVQLTRCTTDESGNILLMTGEGSSITFNLDIFQQLNNYPIFGTVLNNIITATNDYAVSNYLI